MKMTALSLIVLSMCLSSCSKIQSLTEQPKIKCDSVEAKGLVNKTIVEYLTKQAISKQKDLITSEGITVDTATIRQSLKQVKISIEDVRTDQSNPDNQKQFCTAKVSLEIPAKLLQDAKNSAIAYSDEKVEDKADEQDINLSNNTASKDVSYTLQPTDDGKKIYSDIIDGQALFDFARDSIIDALALNLRNDAKAAEQESNTSETEEETTDLDTLDQAKFSIQEANNNLNSVWNSASKTMRDSLLDEQRAWLKRRAIECQLAANNADAGGEEIAQLNCETDMTNARTNELKEQLGL